MGDIRSTQLTDKFLNAVILAVDVRRSSMIVRVMFIRVSGGSLQEVHYGKDSKCSCTLQRRSTGQFHQVPCQGRKPPACACG
mmetsp:Transcript_75845/g.214617  ORF Transcript_75845/g.214617 Transcript_75845/m.214617 type:complete len:82 (+) Transcript_75845:1098-1343(+)